MSLQHDTIQNEIETALEILAKHKGLDLAMKVKAILYANWDRKRLQGFVRGDIDSVADYVRRVVGNYERLNSYIYQLQIEGASEAWLPLLKTIQKWAYRFLVKKGYNPNEATWEKAQDCASEAARSILSAHFPYDTDFEPWARVVVRNTCLKFIRNSSKDVPILEENLDDLEEQFKGLGSFTFRGDSREADELSDAVAQLSSLRRQVIEMKYFQGMSPKQIATKLGKNVRAIHSLQFNALQDLRKILTQNRNKSNE